MVTSSTLAAFTVVNLTLGLHVGRCKKDVKVASFSGEREVASLKIFPVDLVPDKSRLHELSTAGERYLDILRNGHQQVNYEGHTLGSAKRQVRPPNGRELQTKAYMCLAQRKGCAGPSILLVLQRDKIGTTLLRRC